MREFIERHASRVIGMLNGFDRVRFRGTLRLLANDDGLGAFLWRSKVLLKDFKDYALRITERIYKSVESVAGAAARPIQSVASSRTDKEALARQIAERDGVSQGLVCVLSCVEPCLTFAVRGNRLTRHIELRCEQRRCKHYYFYAIDEAVGWMHLRLQTWFPLTIHACINGREWLSRQMDAAGIGYERRDNCFTQVSDVGGAQALLDEQLRADWSAMLDGWVRRFHPLHEQLFDPPLCYYWSADATEWASDVMFKSADELGRLYPRLLRQGMLDVHSVDVLRFLGRWTRPDGGIHNSFQGQITSDCRRRPEGVRIKHSVNSNSVKMYDKHGSVLRVETTINDPRDMRVYRRKEGDKSGTQAWHRMRKGVSDLWRRAQISQGANQRYLQSLAAVDDGRALGELVEGLCRPARLTGRRVRALNPLAMEDLRLLEAIRRGEWAINGFRNRDLRTVLFPSAAADDHERRRQASKVTRLLRLLRAHHLIRKVSGTHRYVLAPAAAATIDALLAARNANVEQLQRLAA